jgi:hypothetical protein
MAMDTSAADERIRSMTGVQRINPSSPSAHSDASRGCHSRSTILSGTIHSLLSKGDTRSLKIAKSVTKCMAVQQAKAQIAAHQSMADRCDSLPLTGTDAGQGVQTRPQPPCVTVQCQQDEAGQLWCKLIRLRGEVDSKEAELAAMIASLEGIQQPIPSCHLNCYGELLLQVMSNSTLNMLPC